MGLSGFCFEHVSLGWLTKIDCPYSCASPNVEDSLRAFTLRAEAKLVVQGQEEKVVLEVWQN